MPWISFKKNPPKEKGKYIVYKYDPFQKKGSIETEWFNQINPYSKDPDNHNLVFKNKNSKPDYYVIYWMKLPKLPKGVENEIS